MFRRIPLIFLFMLVATIGAVPVLAQVQEHCVLQLIPGGGSISQGCFATQAEAMEAATGAVLRLESSVSLQDVDEAIQQYNQDNLIPRATYVIAILYDWTNYQSSSLTLTSTISTGCQYTGYATDFSPTWNDRIESGIGYLDCNYLLMYENTGTTGSLNPCASPCSTFGLLNNQGSSIKLQRTYP